MHILSGLRITECAAFIAGPFATMSLAAMGAEVIRIDPLAGGIDYRRWPVSRATGQSLYWAGLNKGKKSVAIDLASEEGRELAQAIITAPGDAGGLFVTNFPSKGWLDYDRLRQRREDLIMVSIVGNRDGSTALDYTVNSAVGFPFVTGEGAPDHPVNHALPAWDFICGQTAATALLAAERHRRLTGEGQRARIALSDIAFAIVADLGLVAEVQVNGEGRGRFGNDIYGAFGRDFATRDGRRLMIAAVSVGQWKALVAATGIGAAVTRIESECGVDFRNDGDRFTARDAIASLLAPWFAARDLADAARELDAARVCWGPYQSFEQMVKNDPRCSTASALFEHVDHPNIGTTLTPRSPIGFGGVEPVGAAAGPLLGADTAAVLHDVLGLPERAIGNLRERGVIGG